MSLRAFHLVFIALSVVLAAFVAAWATGQYRVEHDMVYAVTGVVALLTSAGLVAYGARFQRKTRHLLTVLLVLGVPRVALACPVCFGQSDAPMAKAMNQGILLMLVIVGGVLAAFATFSAAGRYPASPSSARRSSRRFHETATRSSRARQTRHGQAVPPPRRCCGCRRCAGSAP